MRKSDILYYVIMGNLLISAPIFLFCWIELLSPSAISRPFNIIYVLNLIYVIGVSHIYWSITIPYYKLYSIKNMQSKEEYLLWKKWSINTLLFWPEKFSFKLECWNKQNFIEYKKRSEAFIK